VSPRGQGSDPDPHAGIHAWLDLIVRLSSTHGVHLPSGHEPAQALWRRLLRVAAIILAALLLLVLSGLLLADHLRRQQGAPSHVLPLQPAQTRIDQQIVPLQEAHPGQSGVAFSAMAWMRSPRAR
jgi:hypothetical protein